MDLDLLKFLAAKNVCDGKLYEPRIYSQTFNFDQSGLVNPLYSDEDLFRNAEQYPVRITHVLAQIRDASGATSIAERDLQGYSLRFRMNDTFYMNDDPTPVPLFHNVPCAASDIITRATSTWKFNHPVYMGNRDTFQVRVALEYAVDVSTEATLQVWVAFHGFGALSRRPKELAGYTTFNPQSGELVIPDGFFRNDGTEPLEIHAVHCTVLPPTGSAGIGAVGNIRRPRLSIRLVGNGTNQNWSTSDNPNNTVCAGLWSATTSRAMVHALPFAADNARGWIWEPNQGLQIEVTGPLSGPTQSQINIALLGEIVVL